MDNYLNYFENKNFVRWALSPDEQNQRYWDEYLKSHPEERQAIEAARLVLSQLKSSGKPVEQEELNALLPGIYTKINQGRRAPKLRRIALNTLKYAAIAVLFFATGIGFMEAKYQDTLRELSTQMANVSVFNGRHARLILSDGKSIVLRDKQSNIQYRENGTIIINHTDTISVPSHVSTAGLNQIIVPYGKNSSLTLPDGTVAYINAGSRLLFPQAFEGKNREVFLVGEGYFEVRHNPKRPFLVKTSDIHVEAVGTTFNVSAYPSDTKIEVVLVEGKVHVAENSFKLLKTKQTMHPNDILCFDKENADIDLKQVKVENYTSWHDGFLNFESVELHKVMEKLERYYDIQVSYTNSLLEKKKITGKLALRQNQDDVLRVLASTTTVQIQKTDENNYIIK
ncbi:MAG: FecR family protein [Mangrovibacterium sp.]